MSRIKNEIFFQIKLRYEFGEDLKELSDEFGIPISTLEKRKYKDESINGKWQKGIRSGVGYKYVLDEKEDNLKKISDEISKADKNIQTVISQIFLKIIKEANEKLKEGKEVRFDPKLLSEINMASNVGRNIIRNLSLSNNILKTSEELALAGYRLKEDELTLKVIEYKDGFRFKMLEAKYKEEMVAIQKQKAGIEAEEQEDSGFDSAIEKSSVDIKEVVYIEE